MATIRAYTTIEQSRKLAEILPLDTADMLWEQHGAEPYVTIKPWTTIGKSIGCHCLSCWSLTALLGVLPEKYTELIKEGGMYRIIIKDSYMTCLFDNPIDACVVMIEKLHEINLL